MLKKRVFRVQLGVFDQIVKAFGAVIPRINFGRDSAKIDSLAALEQFVSTRSAFIGQKKLFGYLKGRIGTRWPKMFEDEIFVEGINIASMNVYAACLSDLTIFAVANALPDGIAGVSDRHRNDLAQRIYAHGLSENVREDIPQFNPDAALEEFDTRLHDTQWSFGAAHPANFTRSPAAVLKWAPIADELKQFDTEIVENSVKFAWVDVREQFMKRVVPAHIAREIEGKS